LLFSLLAFVNQWQALLFRHLQGNSLLSANSFKFCIRMD